MNKEEIMKAYSIPEKGVLNKEKYLPKDFRFGIEIEFPYDKKEEIDLQGNFKYYNKTELEGKWSLDKEYNTEYPSNITIGEFVSPILGDNIETLDQLNVIVQLVGAFQHPTLKAGARNTHFHFDMKLLGDSLEYVRPFLQIFRAYENIIFRIATSETGKIRKSGIANIISKALKEEKIGNLLKVFNGGEYNIHNLIQYRRLPINLFNIGAYYERPNKDAKPGVIFEKRGTINQQMQSGRFVLDTTKYKDSTKYDIEKTLTPTMELRLTPSTDKLGFLQQHLLLYSALIYMARTLDRNPELKEKVNERNKTIDMLGPQIYDLEFDTGIEDILSYLPKNLGTRLLLPYVYSQPIKLYDRNKEK